MKQLSKLRKISDIIESPPIEEKQPCWYAKIEEGKSRLSAKWLVGVKCEAKDPIEYSFRISRLGDVNDDKIWAGITSQDTAIEMIKIFRKGGKKAVSDWIEGKVG